MAFLYINTKGKPHRRHSYSAGNTYDQSPYKYYLQKIMGWKENDNLARFEFGKAIENAVQWHHEHNAEGAVEKFVTDWSQHKDNLQLRYTKVEKDWQTCLQSGIEMIRLYKIRQPQLPIPLGGQVLFQREFSKEVFPGDPNYGEIEQVGKLDIVAYVAPEHPMLPRLNWKPEYGPYRPIIVDIKAQAQDFPEQYGIAAYDLQLRQYSWLSGIRDVALLVFVKKSRSLSKGSSVTLLADAGPFRAGQEAVIAHIQEPVKPTKKDPNPDPPVPLGIYLVANDYLITEMNKAQGKRPGTEDLDTTNEAKARKYAWLREFGALIAPENITKQRLQFNAGYVSVESAADAGLIPARQIMNIVTAWQNKAYPSTFGIRFPHDDRQDPYFRAFVLNDEAFRAENFTKRDEESLDDLFADIESEDV